MAIEIVQTFSENKWISFFWFNIHMENSISVQNINFNSIILHCYRALLLVRSIMMMRIRNPPLRLNISKILAFQTFQRPPACISSCQTRWKICCQTFNRTLAFAYSFLQVLPGAVSFRTQFLSNVAWSFKKCHLIWYANGAKRSVSTSFDLEWVAIWDLLTRTFLECGCCPGERCC